MDPTQSLNDLLDIDNPNEGFNDVDIYDPNVQALEIVGLTNPTETRKETKKQKSKYSIDDYKLMRDELIISLADINSWLVDMRKEMKVGAKARDWEVLHNMMKTKKEILAELKSLNVEATNYEVKEDQLRKGVNINQGIQVINQSLGMTSGPANPTQLPQLINPDLVRSLLNKAKKENSLEEVSGEYQYSVDAEIVN